MSYEVNLGFEKIGIKKNAHYPYYDENILTLGDKTMNFGSTN